MKKILAAVALLALGAAIGHFATSGPDFPEVEVSGTAVVNTCDCVQQAMDSGLHECADWAKLTYEQNPNSTAAEQAAAAFAKATNADDPRPEWTGPRLCKETDEYGPSQEVFSIDATNHRVEGEVERARELLPTGKVVVVKCIPTDPRKIQGSEIYGVDPERNEVVIQSHAG